MGKTLPEPLRLVQVGWGSRRFGATTITRQGRAKLLGRQLRYPAPLGARQDRPHPPEDALLRQGELIVILVRGLPVRAVQHCDGVNNGVALQASLLDEGDDLTQITR